MKYYIIKREINFCPICEDEHEVVLIKYVDEVKVKGEIIECEVQAYYCEETQERFENGELVDENLQKIRDAYRIKHGLLTRKEIIEIRNKYGITQEELAIILGLGEKTIARYESSIIQDKPYDVLIRKFNDDYNFAYDMLIKSKEKLNQRKFDQIRDTIIDLIIKETPSLYNEIMLKNQYLKHDEESSVNGFTILNIPKIKSMLAYFARFTKNLFSVKLMKLLWYSDAVSFLRTGKAMSGLVYQHMPYGALPKGFGEVECLDSVEREQMVYYDCLATQYFSKNKDMIDESLFTSEELDILHDVCVKFENTSGKELSEIMHQEDAYKYTYDREIIDFSIIKHLRAIQ